MISNLLSTLCVRAVGKAAYGFAAGGLDETLGWVGLSRRNNRALPVAGYIALGALVGAGAALLLTTEKGQRTRERAWFQFERARVATARLVRHSRATVVHAVDPADNGVPAEVHYQPEHPHQS